LRFFQESDLRGIFQNRLEHRFQKFFGRADCLLRIFADAPAAEERCDLLPAFERFRLRLAVVFFLCVLAMGVGQLVTYATHRL
jgi:hypothetical protein